MLLKSIIVGIRLSDIKMSASMKVTIHEGRYGSKYYTFDNADNAHPVKYSIFFPLEEAVWYEENYHGHDGPKWCGNCLSHGSCRGVFVAYCANCVYRDFPGCGCTFTRVEDEWVPCDKDGCIFKTYLKNVDMSTIGDWDFNVLSSDSTIEEVKHLAPELDPLWYEDLEKGLEKVEKDLEVVPMYAREILNKHRVVCDEAVLLDRYRTVEMQASQQDAKNKILEYEQQDRIIKEKYNDWLHERDIVSWQEKYKILKHFEHEEEERKKSEEAHVKKYTEAFKKDYDWR
jgi:hypothetical protein